MELSVLFGVSVAVLWGSADSLAAVAARRVGALQTTALSQLAGLFLLLLLFGGSWLFFPLSLPFPSAHLPQALCLGMLTGLSAAIGYLAFYQSLMFGPVALVSPLTSSSAAVTLCLSFFVLHDHLLPSQLILLGVIFVGGVLVVIDISAFHAVCKKSQSSFLRQRGILWAVVALLAFAGMDFGIGASAHLEGWFFPVLFTRAFSLVFLLAFFSLLRSHIHAHQQTPPLQKPYVQSGRIRAVRLIPQQEPRSQRRREPGRGIHCERRKTRGTLLVVSAGALESVAVLLFSVDTKLASTGIAAILASNYSAVTVIIGLLVFRERLAVSQVFGLALIFLGLALLT